MHDTPTRTERRIIAEGDGQVITRRARQYGARAAIIWNPHDNAPMLELEVSPFGAWELVTRHHGTSDARTLARGHITDDGTTLEPNPDPWSALAVEIGSTTVADLLCTAWERGTLEAAGVTLPDFLEWARERVDAAAVWDSRLGPVVDDLEHQAADHLDPDA